MIKKIPVTLFLLIPAISGHLSFFRKEFDYDICKYKLSSKKVNYTDSEILLNCEKFTTVKSYDFSSIEIYTNESNSYLEDILKNIKIDDDYDFITSNIKDLKTYCENENFKYIQCRERGQEIIISFIKGIPDILHSTKGKVLLFDAISFFYLSLRSNNFYITEDILYNYLSTLNNLNFDLRDCDYGFYNVLRIIINSFIFVSGGRTEEENLLILTTFENIFSNIRIWCFASEEEKELTLTIIPFFLRQMSDNNFKQDFNKRIFNLAKHYLTIIKNMPDKYLDKDKIYKKFLFNLNKLIDLNEIIPYRLDIEPFKKVRIIKLDRDIQITMKYAETLSEEYFEEIDKTLREVFFIVTNTFGVLTQEKIKKINGIVLHVFSSNADYKFHNDYYGYDGNSGGVTFGRRQNIIVFLYPQISGNKKIITNLGHELVHALLFAIIGLEYNDMHTSFIEGIAETLGQKDCGHSYEYQKDYFNSLETNSIPSKDFFVEGYETSLPYTIGFFVTKYLLNNGYKQRIMDICFNNYTKEEERGIWENILNEKMSKNIYSYAEQYFNDCESKERQFILSEDIEDKRFAKKNKNKFFNLYKENMKDFINQTFVFGTEIYLLRDFGLYYIYNGTYDKSIEGYLNYHVRDSQKIRLPLINSERQVIRTIIDPTLETFDSVEFHNFFTDSFLSILGKNKYANKFLSVLSVKPNFYIPTSPDISLEKPFNSIFKVVKELDYADHLLKTPFNEFNTYSDFINYYLEMENQNQMSKDNFCKLFVPNVKANEREQKIIYDLNSELYINLTSLRQEDQNKIITFDNKNIQDILEYYFNIDYNNPNLLGIKRNVDFYLLKKPFEFNKAYELFFGHQTTVWPTTIRPTTIRPTTVKQEITKNLINNVSFKTDNNTLLKINGTEFDIVVKIEDIDLFKKDISGIKNELTSFRSTLYKQNEKEIGIINNTLANYYNLISSSIFNGLGDTNKNKRSPQILLENVILEKIDNLTNKFSEESKNQNQNLNLFSLKESIENNTKMIRRLIKKEEEMIPDIDLSSLKESIENNTKMVRRLVKTSLNITKEEFEIPYNNNLTILIQKESKNIKKDIKKDIEDLKKDLFLFFPSSEVVNDTINYKIGAQTENILSLLKEIETFISRTWNDKIPIINDFVKEKIYDVNFLIKETKTDLEESLRSKIKETKEETKEEIKEHSKNLEELIKKETHSLKREDDYVSLSETEHKTDFLNPEILNKINKLESNINLQFENLNNILQKYINKTDSLLLEKEPNIIVSKIIDFYKKYYDIIFLIIFFSVIYGSYKGFKFLLQKKKAEKKDKSYLQIPQYQHHASAPMIR